MAVDITNVKSGDTVIKHGISVVNVAGTGHQNMEDLVYNLPEISSISGKYTDRFDDRVYYTDISG